MSALPHPRPALDDEALEHHAQCLYPHDAYLQAQWLRGVRLVRTTAHGWLLDPPRPRPLPDDDVHREDAP
jgi:hypothetical protein